MESKAIYSRPRIVSCFFTHKKKKYILRGIQNASQVVISVSSVSVKKTSRLRTRLSPDTQVQWFDVSSSLPKGHHPSCWTLACSLLTERRTRHHHGVWHHHLFFACMTFAFCLEMHEFLPSKTSFPFFTPPPNNHLTVLQTESAPE